MAPIDGAIGMKININQPLSTYGWDCVTRRNNPATIAQVVSNYESNLNFAAFGPRILFALLAGYWSDKNGRKMLIGVPIFGQIATSAVFIANWALLSRLPFEVLYAELVNEACGNFIVYYLGKPFISCKPHSVCY